jgi:acetoin utilization protein AcuC
MNGHEIPGRLPEAAQAVLRGLRWTRPGSPREIQPEQHWITTLADAPREGPIRPEIRDRIGELQGRRSA